MQDLDLSRLLAIAVSTQDGHMPYESFPIVLGRCFDLEVSEQLHNNFNSKVGLPYSALGDPTVI